MQNIFHFQTRGKRFRLYCNHFWLKNNNEERILILLRYIIGKALATLQNIILVGLKSRIYLPTFSHKHVPTNFFLK
jgi:hypothetical protein